MRKQPCPRSTLWPGLCAAIARGLLVWLMCASNWVFAEGVLIVTDSRVAQYRDAVSKAIEVLPQAPVLDVAQPDVAEQLKARKPTVALTVGQKALASTQAAVPETVIVYCLVLGASAPTSPNATGFRLEVSPADQLAFFRQVHPRLKRIAVLYQTGNLSSYVAEARRAAQSQGIELQVRAVVDAKDVRSALSELLSGAEALWLLPDPQLITAEMFSFLLVSTLERKIALFGFFESFTRAGALASVSPDYGATGQKAAQLAQSLAQKPAAARFPLPPPQNSPGAQTINQKTASRLDLELSLDVLNKAHKVIR